MKQINNQITHSMMAILKDTISWVTWAAVGPVSREKSQLPGHCGGKGRQEMTTRRPGVLGCWTAPAGDVRELIPGLTTASSVMYRAGTEMHGAPMLISPLFLMALLY